MEEKRVEETAMELPAGFRFHPTDEELISYYLYPKVLDSKFSTRAIGDVDLNKCEPWELPKMAKMGEEKELYFFCVRDRKYPTGMRTNRATESGYWKATGKDKEIIKGKSLVGMKKTLVFYKGRAPKGEKSNWVMHEFRLEGILSSQYLPSSSKHEWVISRVFEKSNNSSGVGGKKSFSYSESQLVMRMKSEEDDQLLGMDNDDEDESSSFEFNQSSSLPPLMDPSSPPPPSLSYYHTSKLPSIGPVSVTHDDNHQYVSCFSNNMINPLNHYRYQYCDPYHIDTGPHFNNNFTNPYPSYLSQSKHNYNTSYPIRGAAAAAAAAGAGNSSSSSSQYPSFDAVSKHDILIRSILDGNSGDHMPSAGAHNINRDIFREGGVTTTATTMSVSQDTCLSTDIINREISSSTYQMISSCGGGSLLNRENQEEEEEGPSTSDCGGGGLIDIDSFWSY